MSTFSIPNPSGITEDAFTQRIASLADLAGWQVFDRGRDHGEGLGLPRLILARNGVTIFAVVRSSRGAAKIPLATQAWADAITGDMPSAPTAARTHPVVIVMVWTPDDWAEIERTLWPEG